MTDFQWFRSLDLSDHKYSIGEMVSFISKIVDVFQLLIFISAIQFLLERRMGSIDIYWILTLLVLLLMYILAISLFHRIIFTAYVAILRFVYNIYFKTTPLRTGWLVSVPSILFLIASGFFVQLAIDGFLSFIQELAK